MKKQQFGAGIWHFATYVDRYATDGYGEPRSVLDAIELAGKVKDLSVVDINYPYFGGNFTNEEIKASLDKVDLNVIGITPEIYTKEFRKGAFTNPDPGIRNRAHELITQACEAVRFFNASYVKLWPGQDGWDYPFQVDHGTLWKNSMDGVARLASENPDLKWESSKTLDIGIEGGLYDDRVHFTLEAYRKYSEGVIMDISLPPSSGFTSYWDNVGEILNKGIELSLASHNIEKPNFSWSTNLSTDLNFCI